MAKIKVRRHTTYTIEHDEHEFEVPIEPADHIDPVIKELSDGGHVVGYAAHDEDCEAPLKTYRGRKYECDGSGMLYRFDHREQERIEGLAEIGYNEYGSRDEEIVPNPYAVLLDKFEHGQEQWYVATGEDHWCDPSGWDTSNGAGVWVPDESCLDHIESSGIKGLLSDDVTIEYESQRNSDGTAITRPARDGDEPYLEDGTMIDERFHNVITVTFADGTKFPGFPAEEAQRFKTFAAAYQYAAGKLGIKIDEEALAKGRRKVAVQCAAEAMEQYTMWANADCWGHVVLVFDKDGEEVDGAGDSCWGYIGSDYAEERVKEEVEATYANYTASKEAKT